MKLVPAVREVEKIAYQNVVRKREKFYYTEMESRMQAFVSDIVNAGYSIKGPLFYSLNNVPLDKQMDIEFFMPIVEGTFDLKGYRFSSYFVVESLIKIRVTHDFDKLTEQAYAMLLLSLEENDLDINTPFYHILPSDGSAYIEIYLGYTDRPQEETEEGVYGF